MKKKMTMGRPSFMPLSTTTTFSIEQNALKNARDNLKLISKIDGTASLSLFVSRRIGEMNKEIEGSRKKENFTFVIKSETAFSFREIELFEKLFKDKKEFFFLNFGIKTFEVNTSGFIKGSFLYYDDKTLVEIFVKELKIWLNFFSRGLSALYNKTFVGKLQKNILSNSIFVSKLDGNKLKTEIEIFLSITNFEYE